MLSEVITLTGTIVQISGSRSPRQLLSVPVEVTSRIVTKCGNIDDGVMSLYWGIFRMPSYEFELRPKELLRLLFFRKICPDCMNKRMIRPFSKEVGTK